LIFTDSSRYENFDTLLQSFEQRYGQKLSAGKTAATPIQRGNCRPPLFGQPSLAAFGLPDGYRR
jgi:hypothetical protein